MNIYYITGTSSGIGKAITENLLSDNNNFVIGISRSNLINHKNYKHFNIDLSQPNNIIDFNFDEFENADTYTLINNSGIIGDIKHIGKINNSEIINTYNINTISSSILINNFVKKYKTNNCQKIILNISSGAGRHSIESWSSYCASKSAMDMFSLVVNDDLHFISNKFKIFSVAPGIVETNMQENIRKADKSDFSGVDNFINYKKNKLLSSSNEIAKKLIYITKNPTKFNNVILDVRNLPN